MIELITGTPGAGKTLRAMWLLEQPEYQDRLVYSNIPGTDHEPIPDMDWTKTPEGSIVIYDEAQQEFPGTGKAGNSLDHRVSGMETHRHTGHDIVLLTQRYALVHHHVRSLVGRHSHLIKKGTSTAIVHQADEVFDPKDRHKRDDVVQDVFRYPKDVFDKYRSSSMHTEVQTKKKLPAKAKLFLTVILLGGLAVSFAAYKTVGSFGNPTDSEPVEAVADASNVVEDAVPSSSSDEEEKPDWAKEGLDGISGCITKFGKCACYDHEGRLIDFEQEQCQKVANKDVFVTSIKGSGSDLRRDSRSDSPSQSQSVDVAQSQVRSEPPSIIGF